MKLLLISNSTTPGQPYLQWPTEHIRKFLGGCAESVAFVPYAAVSFSYDEYEARVQKAFEPLGIEVRSVHRESDPARAIREAEAIVVGGGNTFALLKKMQEQGLVDAIRMAVTELGTPYVGWSAGSNVCCPTICTTNDMPIVEPKSFAAVGAVPFQINPHYLDAHPDGHAGETREQRIGEYLVANPTMWVAGLRESCLLHVTGGANSGSGDGAGSAAADTMKVTLVGDRPMRVFRHGTQPREVNPGDDLSFLLQ
ncbi:MAG: dipeptidase PepE [Alistipes sp.]|jgi:dipeptidase E|nr:dipeptidase PepE [Alistipes sp.]